MPIYEYNCPACGHAFEVLIRGKTDQPARCPACGKGKPAKVLSAFAVPSTAFKTAAQRCGSCQSGRGACPSEGSCCGSH
jgi:putative FmdB family regulatory protein